MPDEGVEGGTGQRGTRTFCRAMEMFVILIVVVLLQYCTCVKLITLCTLNMRSLVYFHHTPIKSRAVCPISVLGKTRVGDELATLGVSDVQRQNRALGVGRGLSSVKTPKSLMRRLQSESVCLLTVSGP